MPFTLPRDKIKDMVEIVYNRNCVYQTAWDGDGPAGGCLTGPENLAKAVWPSIKPLCLDGLEFAAAIQKVPEIVHRNAARKHLTSVR